MKAGQDVLEILDLTGAGKRKLVSQPRAESCSQWREEHPDFLQVPSYVRETTTQPDVKALTSVFVGNPFGLKSRRSHRSGQRYIIVKSGTVPARVRDVLALRFAQLGFELVEEEVDARGIERLIARDIPDVQKAYYSGLTVGYGLLADDPICLYVTEAAVLSDDRIVAHVEALGLGAAASFTFTIEFDALLNRRRRMRQTSQYDVRTPPLVEEDNVPRAREQRRKDKPM
jgi:hypothetical protein